MDSLKGKVALVTGGTKGIGRATSLALAKAGASVAINYRSGIVEADDLIEAIGPNQAFAIQADAGSVAGAELMVNQAVHHFGRLDILVKCAGTSPMNDLANTTEPAFDSAIQLNVKGPYFVAQKAAAQMTEGSRIIFLSSSLTSYSSVFPEDLLYCVCKGAIEQMTRVLARDLARRQINVNAVAPGPIDGEHFRAGKSDAVIETVKAAVPCGRLGSPEDIADVIVFLCSDQSRFVTGQVIQVDGGMA